jgi:hypothetical protein
MAEDMYSDKSATDLQKVKNTLGPKERRLADAVTGDMRGVAAVQDPGEWNKATARAAQTRKDNSWRSDDEDK